MPLCSRSQERPQAIPADQSIPAEDILGLFRKWVAPGKKPKKAIDTTDVKHFSILPAVGYTLQTGLAALLAANYSFRPEKYPGQNQSFVNAAVSYTQRNQVFLISQSSIWLKNNHYNLPGELRLMKYPQYTYGFGSKSLPSDNYMLDYAYLRLYEDGLVRVRENLYAGPGYRLDYHWGIKQKRKDSTATDYDKYGYSTASLSSGLAFNIVQDNRDNPINAAKGSLVKMMVRLNSKVLGSNSSWQALALEARKFIPTARGKGIIALWSYNWFTLGGNAPYLDLPSLGWDGFNNTGRGYIQSRYMGRQMIYDEAEYRFRISRNGVFGAVIFANAHSFTELSSGKFEAINIGYGGGIRIKLNKYSGANIAIDYGFGSHGSKGLFVNLGEVF